MQKINLSKDSPDWEIWKKVGIGGGDVGAIYGISPYNTAFELWEFKTKRKERPDLSGLYVIEKGNRLEVAARQAYEELTGYIVSPEKCVNADRQWQKAALDGITEEADHVVEFKYVGAEIFKAAMSDGFIPAHYRLQCLHYVLVTGASSCDYVCINDDGDIAIVEVTWTDDELAELLKAEEVFYRHIIEDEPPKKTNNDVDDLNSNNEFVSLMADYVAAKAEFDSKKNVLDEIKKKLNKFAMNAKRSVSSDGGKVTRYWREGTLDTKKFLEDEGLEVPESFRKKGAWQYKITPTKEKIDVE